MANSAMVKYSTRVLSADDPEALAEAVDLLRTGQVVAFPTDTVYGIGVHAFIAEAVALLYKVKERPPDKFIPLLVSDNGDLSGITESVPDLAWRLTERFWPGALTLVLPKAPSVPTIVSAGPGVAVRAPDHAVARMLIRALGAPLATTSANLSGGSNPVTAADVLTQLGGRIPLILDGGPCPGGMPSTVLDLTQSPPRILREGGIPADMLEKFWA